MNSRRTVIIAAALALAALAFFGNVFYLSTAQQRAYKGATLVDVYVVKDAVPKGTDGAAALEKNIELKKVPTDFRPGTALTKANINDIKGKVAISTLPPGQIVVDGQFVDPKETVTTFQQSIKPGNVAVTVSVDSVHGVAGLLMPGDLVDIIVTGKDSGNDASSFSKVMYQNVKILAIGANTAQPANEAAGTTKTTAAAATADTGLITFMVPLEAASRLSLVANSGNGTSLYLALVPPNNPVLTGGVPDFNTDNVYNNLPATPYPNNQVPGVNS